MMNVSHEVLLLLLSLFLLSLGGDTSAKHCETSAYQIRCKCPRNTKFFLPYGYNYENVSKLIILSCTVAELNFSSLMEARGVRVIIIQNVSQTLTFEPFLMTNVIDRLELLNIHRIPLITHNTFVNTKKIEMFRIEDTVIDNFEENLIDTSVTHFIMKNVTIGRIGDLNLSERGKILQINSCDFRNIERSLNFAYFENIQIIDSKFQLSKSGQISIAGKTVLIKNNLFTNASINIVGSDEIRINSTCAEGKSSLRLSAARIKSFGNKLPTEIVYATNNTSDEMDIHYIQNNTVCVAGNCKCPKSNATALSYCRYNYNMPIVLHLILAVLLLITTHF